MKKLIFLVLIAAAGWFGWKNYPQLFEKRAGHDAIVRNESGTELERLRLTVDGQTLVKETLPDGQSATFPFKVTNDASFSLVWKQGPRERDWRGGMVPRGPMLQRHIIHIDQDGEVLYRAEPK